METYTITDNAGQEITMTTVTFAGQEIGVPVEALTDDKLRQKIFARHMASPQFDALIDKQTGSPARVRALVGSAPIKDKLRSPRRLYDDHKFLA